MAGFVAVHVRHHHVEDDDRRIVLRIRLEGLAAVARQDDVVAPAGEILFEELQILLVVVNGEHDLALGGQRRLRE